MKICINIIVLFSLLAASEPVFGERQDFGEIQYSPINEASGIAASYKNENVFWTHNDSGDQNRIYSFNNEGQHLGVYTLQNCSARDFEDIAIGPGPDENQDYLYVGNIGDNGSQYDTKYIYRLIEPDVESDQAPVNETLYNIDIIAYQYEDGNRDAETLMLDPLTKDIIIVSKREEAVHIYKLPYPQSSETLLTAELIHTMDFYPDDDSNYPRQIVSGDISRDGAEILVKSYPHIFHFPRYENQSIAQAFTNTITMVEYMMEPQGEAVGWHPDGFGYFTISEEASNIPCHLYFYPRIVGCMDQNADNYSPYALEDDESCIYLDDVCSACNYYYTDGYPGFCCDMAFDEGGLTCLYVETEWGLDCGGCKCFGDIAFCVDQDLVMCLDYSCAVTLSQCGEGCTDPEACNFDTSATVDDGSCTGPYLCDDGVTLECNLDNCPDDCSLGDINCDGILNVLDIVIMVSMVLDNQYSITADVNSDGFVDILDVVMMVNILVGGLP